VSADPARIEMATSPWEARRIRAEELRDRHAFAGEVLTLYLALLPVQEEAWRATRESAPAPAELSQWAVIRVLPAVLEATVAAGPAALAAEARERVAAGEAEAAFSRWLAGDELDPIDAYLARVSLAPALEALGEQAGAACAAAEADGGALCPCCGGRPQLSIAADSGDELVTGRRDLLCARCATRWDYTRSACPACGESDEDRLLVYAEQWSGPVVQQRNGDGAGQAVFPNLRVVGCRSCRTYLIEIEMARDARAVPEVDELAALPLDLYAADQGLTKVTPNLMGF
jgi:formate dehydrogenase maturation protein FdhE